MAFVKKGYKNAYNVKGFGIGDYVRLTQEKRSLIGKFEVGSIVKIDDIGVRGYSISDEYGNKIIECGFTGFENIGD